MRHAISGLLAAAMLCSVATPKDASATITISLEWGACGGGTGCDFSYAPLGTDAIFVVPGGGQTLRLDVFLSHDVAAGLEQHSFSLNFDTNLDNELNLGPMAPVEWGGTDAIPDRGSQILVDYVRSPRA